MIDGGTVVVDRIAYPAFNIISEVHGEWVEQYKNLIKLRRNLDEIGKG